MITIEELLSHDPSLRRFSSEADVNPLTEDDALQEAQLLDVRFDALRSTVGLLFELRMALELREANTGVLVARGVRELSWTAGPRSTAKTAWTIGGACPAQEEPALRIGAGIVASSWGATHAGGGGGGLLCR